MKKMILALTLVIVLSFTGVAFAGSSADSTAVAIGEANAFIQNNEAQQFTGLPTNFPIVIPLIQGGKVGDITAQLPKFAYVGLTPLSKDDKVVDLKVRLGSIFDRVRLEDIELDLIAFYKETAANGKKGWDPKKMRYLVQYKDSAMGAGIGGGGSAGASAINGGSTALAGGGTLSVLPGYSRSTADPLYVLKLYLIE